MLVTRKRPALSLSDLADLSWFPFAEPVLRIEEFRRDDSYVVRAEIPGVDPAKDVEINTVNGLLRIGVVRTEETHEGGHSEFRYGTMHRTVGLPEGAEEDTIKAAYTDGILEISMKVGHPKATGRKIAISNGKPAK